MIVNGLTDPIICMPCCAGGPPETFHLNDGTSHPATPSADLRCNDGHTVTINWAGHEAATEMWCANEWGELDHILIEVPEVGLVPGLLVGLCCAAFMAWWVRPGGNPE